MSKSKTFTTFIINGKEWTFSPQKFGLLFEEKRTNEWDKTTNRKITKSHLYEEISPLVNVSPDGVKKWLSGANGPCVKDSITALAQYFGVEETDLLVPVLNENNNSIVTSATTASDYEETNRVFKESLSILLRRIHLSVSAVDPKERQRIYRENQMNAKDDLRKLSRSVYTNALSLSTYVSNKLQRLLMDMEEIIYDRPPEAWCDLSDEISCYDTAVLFAYYYSPDKESVCMESCIDGRAYVLDEIEFAEDLDLEDIVDTDDYFDENSDDVNVLMKYGYQGSFEITPTMVYEHILTKYLTAVFRHYFPDFCD